MEFVYLAVNEAMPGLVKIGKTGNVKSRMDSLAAESGVPMPFMVVYQHETEYAGRIEIQLHDMFAYCRVSSGKEFFRVDWRAVVVALLNVVDADRIGDPHNRIVRQINDAVQEESSEPPLPLSVREQYIRYVGQRVANADTATAYANALDYLGAHHLGGQNVYEIDSIEEARSIRERLANGGDLHAANVQYRASIMGAAMRHYVRFLQQRGG